jgi:hypothetical protein
MLYALACRRQAGSCIENNFHNHQATISNQVIFNRVLQYPFDSLSLLHKISPVGQKISRPEGQKSSRSEEQQVRRSASQKISKSEGQRYSGIDTLITEH